MALKKVTEPKGTEFCWGRGLMAPPDRGYEPMEWEEHLAAFRTDSTDPGSTHDITDRVRETGPAK